MSENKILEGLELLKHLSLTFGPTGSEEYVADEIVRQLEGTDVEIIRDRMSNVFAIKRANAHPVQTVMLSAHMDEVGFIIKDIDGEGYIRFSCLGGIDSRVLCGRKVTFRGKDGDVSGVIASKAIHHQSAEERKNATKASDMYVDIGATSREDAESVLSKGDSGTFDSEFVIFGENDGYAKCKALDDRLGCVVMIEILRKLKAENVELPFDLVCAFTVREEIGISGATAAAHRFRPDYAIILETTAIADLPDVPKNSRVAEVGSGGVVSLMDRSTIYNRDFVDAAMKIAEENGIPAQIKRYVSGGNDAGHIHKTADGTRCLAISAPTRYLHSASCVISIKDFESIKSHVYAILTSYNFS